MAIYIYSIAILGMFMTLVLFCFFLITLKGNKTGNRILATLILVFGFQIFIALIGAIMDTSILSNPICTFTH